MGNGAMLRRSPRSPTAQASGGGPVLGCVCESRSSGSSGDELCTGTEGGHVKVQCKRCNTVRTLAYGASVFTCRSCNSDVRVPLGALSARARLDASEHVRRAEQVVQAALARHSANSQELWEKLKKAIASEENIWDRRVRGVEVARARVLVRTALNTNDVAQAIETLTDALTHWDALGLPLASPEIRASLSQLKREDDLESHWRCLSRALASADRVDLEFWCDEAASHGFAECIPLELVSAAKALHGKERAMLAEWEYQSKLKARAAEAHAERDASALRSLAAEARLIGEDASAVDAVLALLGQTTGAAVAASSGEITDSLANLKASVIKDELARRGINSAGVVEKDELVTLLRSAISKVPATTDMPVRSASSDSASSSTTYVASGASSSGGATASTARPSPREASPAPRPQTHREASPAPRAQPQREASPAPRPQPQREASPAPRPPREASPAPRPPASAAPAMPQPGPPLSSVAGTHAPGIRGTSRAHETNAFNAFCKPRPSSARASSASLRPPPPPPTAPPRFSERSRTNPACTSQPQSDSYRQSRSYSQRASSPSPSPRPPTFEEAASPRPPTQPSPGERGSQRHSSMPARQRPPSAGPTASPRPPPPRSPPTRQLPTTRAAALACLGLEGKPANDEIRRAYKQAALKWHPDRPQNHNCMDEAKDRFQEVRAAFDLLQAPVRNLCAVAGAGG